jgi:hypothetical protein
MGRSSTAAGWNSWARGCRRFRTTAKVNGSRSIPWSLIERVRVSAERHAVLALDAVATAVPRIFGVALRKFPQLPPTIAERIKDYRAQNVADWVMYRKALASAAEARGWPEGWPVHWYDARSVAVAARQILGVENLDAHFLQVRRAVGPPWNQDHKLAMAAAIVTATAGGGVSRRTKSKAVANNSCPEQLPSRGIELGVP